tara:strand:+ start:18262 stop:19902 length:1641 start_codon:yes stop_codon:yes gene_type:complete
MLIDHFPAGYKPTDKQKSAFDLIDDKLSSPKKFLIIQAPTGTGKSFISKTVANLARKSSQKYNDLVDSGDIYKTDIQGNYINSDLVYREETHGCYSLTITKTLQDQYKTLFNDTQILKGKGNYTCAIDEQFEVDTAPCVYLQAQKKKCLDNKCCHYYNAIDNALKNKFSCLSYSKFLSLQDHLKRRQYLVLDEASELESELVKEFTFVLPHKDLKKKGILFKYHNNRNKLYESLFNCYSDLGEYLQDVKKHISRKKSDFSFRSKLVFEYKKYYRIYIGLKTLIKTYRESKYIVEKDGLEIIFTPLKVDLLSKHVFDHADKVILMSATIVGIKSFVKSLGISSDNYDYIDIPSTFEPKLSPILVFKDTPLNAKNLVRTLPKLVNRVEWLLDKHKNEKGIIHTQTNNITEYIKNFIDPKYTNRLLFREPGVKNEHILKQHMESDEPTVLVSPSMCYGIDLKDELGRFQVIMKLPYIPWNDKRAQCIRETDEKWYTLQMLSSLIQACGRATRGEGDHSTTYIMDSNFLRIRELFYNELPVYFRKRCENG